MVPERRPNRRPWVCLWSDCLDSRKLARAGEPAEWLFYKLLALCGEQGEGDTIEDASADDLAWRLRRDPADIEARLASLETEGLIERARHAVRIAGWYAHQAEQTEAERVRAWRDKKKVDAGAERTKRVRTPYVQRTEDRTYTERTCNVLDSDSDADSEQHTSCVGDSAEPIAPPATGGKPEKPDRKKRARTLPADFAPDDTHRKLATEQGVNLDAELAKFRDFHTAKGSLFADWPAAFRTWLRNARQFGARASPPRVNENPGSERTGGSSGFRRIGDETKLGQPSAAAKARAEYACKFCRGMHFVGVSCPRLLECEVP